jgi:hypothetical protein
VTEAQDDAPVLVSQSMATPEDLMAARSRLSDLIGARKAGAGRKTDKEFVEFFVEREAGSAVALSSDVGGTQNLRNRLGQKDPQNATDLTIFYLSPTDNIEGCVEYTVNAFNGRTSSVRPRGPIAFAQQDDASASFAVKEVVQLQPTAASRLVAHLFDARVTDAREGGVPRLPQGVDFFYLRSSDQQDEYADVEGERYHYKTSIPNGKSLSAGAVVVVGHTKDSTTSPGCITGIGRIGEIRPEDDGYATAFYSHYLILDKPISFGDAIENPANNVNSIWKVPAAWVIKVMQEAGILDLDSLPVPFSRLTVPAVLAELEKSGLVFPHILVLRAVAALRSGKHLMLRGVPGTGKTSLGLALARVASDLGLSNEPMMTTGTADWSSVETVGAYRLGKDRQLVFSEGQVLAAMNQDRWLIIDELNRADIDKAIGQLFTVLSGHAVTLPFEAVTNKDEGDGEPVDEEVTYISVVPYGASTPDGTMPLHVPDRWRMIATMNIRDQDLLFSLSEALVRRFAILQIDPPGIEEWDEILSARGQTGIDRWNRCLRTAVHILQTSGRGIGAAVILDMAAFLRSVGTIGMKDANNAELDSEFAAGWQMYVEPQLSDGVDGAFELGSVFKAVDAEVAGEVPPSVTTSTNQESVGSPVADDLA